MEHTFEKLEELDLQDMQTIKGGGDDGVGDDGYESTLMSIIHT